VISSPLKTVRALGAITLNGCLRGGEDRARAGIPPYLIREPLSSPSEMVIGNGKSEVGLSEIRRGSRPRKLKKRE